MWSSLGCVTFQAERGMEEVIWVRRQCEREGPLCQDRQVHVEEAGEI